jgi:hypothetical protein
MMIQSDDEEDYLKQPTSDNFQQREDQFQRELQKLREDLESKFKDKEN